MPILWERHILNCAVAHEAFPRDTEVVDVGSGAGLPGLAIAIVRPDLHLHLVEPMLRRTTWLSDTVAALGLPNVTVHRGRAEEFHGVLQAPFATARAVARIDSWPARPSPCCRITGGWWPSRAARGPRSWAQEEKVLRKLGMQSGEVRSYGEQWLEVPTATVELTLGVRPQPARRQGKRRR